MGRLRLKLLLWPLRWVGKSAKGLQQSMEEVQQSMEEEWEDGNDSERQHWTKQVNSAKELSSNQVAIAKHWFSGASEKSELIVDAELFVYAVDSVLGHKGATATVLRPLADKVMAQADPGRNKSIDFLEFITFCVRLSHEGIRSIMQSLQEGQIKDAARVLHGWIEGTSDSLTKAQYAQLVSVFHCHANPVVCPAAGTIYLITSAEDFQTASRIVFPNLQLDTADWYEMYELKRDYKNGHHVASHVEAPRHLKRRMTSNSLSQSSFSSDASVAHGHGQSLEAFVRTCKDLHRLEKCPSTTGHFDAGAFVDAPGFDIAELVVGLKMVHAERGKVCVRVCACVFVCVRVRVFVCACVCVCMHACMLPPLLARSTGLCHTPHTLSPRPTRLTRCRLTRCRLTRRRCVARAK